MDGVLATLEDRFRGSLDRVRNLVTLYDRVTAPAPGRASVQESELLRAAVVFLHAAPEELLRGLAEWRLPAASVDVLSQIPFVGGDGRRTTLTLGDLAAYRGQSVENVITKSVIAYLARSSYNNTEDVVRLLGQIGLTQEARRRLMGAHAADLSMLMARRHHIAHRLDRNEASGRGHHAATSLGRAKVERWIGVVRQFGNEPLGEVRTLPPIGKAGHDRTRTLPETAGPKPGGSPGIPRDQGNRD
jgi:hypothetical protein